MKQAILEIRHLRERLQAVEGAQHEPVAVIGMGLRFPGGANDPQSFWTLLRDGFDAVTEIPPERWDIEAFYDPDIQAPGKMTTRHGAFLDNVDQFDPHFFGISPREAASMDPQQRLLLEVGWEALESAGQSPDKLGGSQTGVFIGISNSDYFRMVVRDYQKIDTYASTGGTLSVAAGRLAYLLGLHGPAMAIDTACSSSLAAVHLACNSLRQQECSLALVGGTNLILTPEANINFSKAQMMALDGHCKTFDASADGYVRGEGCAVIVLKRLSQALADGDHIRALILGSALNHDGRSNGLTAPNGPAQEAVIRAALEQSGVRPSQVGYVEAHGTGTSLGDPIEAHALGAVFGQDRDPGSPLLIGSVKTNLGHQEAAAGLAGLIKVVLSLQHAEIPPHLHFQTPSPHIDWQQFPLAVSTGLRPWPEVDGRRIAGVSSFGFSGTNAHIVLEAAPPPAQASQVRALERPLHLVALSARSQTAVRELAARYERMLASGQMEHAGQVEQAGQVDLPSLAYSANTGRSHFAHRTAFLAEDSDELQARLSAYLQGSSLKGWWSGQAAPSEQPGVVFLFTGHGSHYVGMGRQLYETQPTFRRIIDQCDEFLSGKLERRLVSVLYPQTEADDPSSIQELTYGQPAMFAIEYALAMLWREWGVEPAAVAGHSVGEYVAACVAGVFSLEEALTLVAERGRLMQALPEDGEMVTVFGGEAQVAPLVAPYAADVSIAAINSPETVVISGRRAAVQEVIAALKAQKIRTRRLPIARAAHSPVVEPMLASMASTGAEIRFSPPQVEFFSTVTGGPVQHELTQPEYWQRHLRQTVRFVDAMQALYAAGYRTFLEIGPSPALISLGQRSVPEDEPALWLPSLREGWGDWKQMLESLARLYTSGATVDWQAFDQPYPRRRLPLPTYPWERKSYWWQGGQQPQPAVQEESALWERALAASRRQAEQAPLDLDLSGFDAKWSSLNRLAGAYIHNAFCGLGLFARRAETHSLDSLLEAGKIRTQYRSLMLRWMKTLASAGEIEALGEDKFRAHRPLEPISLEEPWQDAQGPLADVPFVSEYIRACGERLSQVVTGAESPLELIFPDGSMQRAEALYQDWAHARYFNHIVRAAVESAAGKPLRVLEIGAGTGSTTSAVLPALAGRGASYHFTDVSELFLAKAQEKFQAYDFVRYGLLDIEKDPHAQGYGRHNFDVVIAANVVHATTSLSGTLENVRSLLAPGGLLVLFEATLHQPWYDITTGLIEGWQSFGDDLRQDSPLLSAPEWEMVLREGGFEETAFLPPAGSPAESLGEHVILARPPLPTGASIDADGPIEGEDRSPAASQAQPEEPDMLERLRQALPDERIEILTAYVRSQVASVLRFDPDDPLDRRARLMDLGVDSLMAVELRGRLSSGLKLARKLPATLIFDHPTIEAIVNHLLKEALAVDARDDRSENAKTTPASPGNQEIEAMSDEEVEAMLIKKLKAMR